MQATTGVGVVQACHTPRPGAVCPACAGAGYPQAFVRTNILLSGVGWRGSPYHCLKLARVGRVEGVTCRELLDEFAEKLATKLRFSPVQVTDTIADLLTFLRLVMITNALEVISADPDDNKVLECAAVGRATHIVTGDRHHLLPLGSYQGIAIVTAADFLASVSVR